jgi:aspartyl-tRNA(Asn)/glutamyl-tRNA(Gln) amidotransferase subunit B
VTDGDLYHGNMRFDVNVSVSDSESLGTRAEVKNLNSFRSVGAAVEYEISRQVEILESGGAIKQETRGWLDDKQRTVSQRSKENAQDYRYMPDADIPPVVLTNEQVAEFQADFPKMPGEYRQEFAEMNLNESILNVLLSNRDTAALVSEILQNSNAEITKKVANIMAGLLDIENNTAQTNLPKFDDLIELAKMLLAGEINSNAGDKIFQELMKGGTGTRKIAKKHNLIQNNDTDEISTIVAKVLSDPAAAKAVEDIVAGNDKAIGFLVGLVMKESKGKANPGLAQKIIKDKINAKN